MPRTLTIRMGGLGEPGPIRVVRRILLSLLLLGILVTLTELYLLEHTEDYWQLLPVVLLGLSLGAILLWVVSPSRSTMRVFQAVMLLFLSSGVLGLYLHYRGNVEFELEMYPSLGGIELIWEALKGATPALAPAAMAHLGLVGLAYSYHHPLLTERD